MDEHFPGSFANKDSLRDLKPPDEAEHVGRPLDQQAADQDPGQRPDPGRDSPQDPDPDRDLDQDWTTTAANQEAGEESCGGVPALVITQAEESLRPPSAEPQRAHRPADLVLPRTHRPADLVLPRTPRPADLVLPRTPTDPGLSSGSDGGDMTCSDLLSPKSDSLSLTSERTISRTSEDEDSRSVTASSVMSLFHRVQLDPLEKDWMRSSAVGNMAAQRQLLCQESSLVTKKDFITTALHWAAKQGRQEAVDMMLRSGADVNVRSGYTALHLASIHGHQQVVHALINTYNAKTNIRDYHGKMAVHYWSGGADVFSRAEPRSGGSFYRGRQTQRYGLPSLLSRSRSQGQLSVEFVPMPQSLSHDVLDLQL